MESYVFPAKNAVRQSSGGGTRGPSSRPQTPTPFALLCVPFWTREIMVFSRRHVYV